MRLLRRHARVRSQVVERVASGMPCSRREPSTVQTPVGLSARLRLVGPVRGPRECLANITSFVRWSSAGADVLVVFAYLAIQNYAIPGLESWVVTDGDPCGWRQADMGWRHVQDKLSTGQSTWCVVWRALASL